MKCRMLGNTFFEPRPIVMSDKRGEGWVGMKNLRFFLDITKGGGGVKKTLLDMPHLYIFETKHKHF